MSRRTPPALPRQQPGDLCTDCWVMPGQEHTLSCPEVSPQQFVAYVTWEPDDRPSLRRRFVVIAALTFLASLPWAAVVVLILRSFL